MKNIILIAITALIATSTFAQTSKKEKSATKYSCPMHSDVISDKPGKCSKCGMAMKKEKFGTVAKYACPKCDWTIPPVKGKCPNSTEAVMKDGELKCVYCHDSAGKCAKCGTEMEKVSIKKKKKSKKG